MFPEYKDYLGYIRNPAAKEAFSTVFENLSMAEGVDARPLPHGYMKDISFYSDGARLYSLVPAKDWALFYLRKSGLNKTNLTLADVQADFPYTKLDQRGQITVRLTSPADATLLLALLKVKTLVSAMDFSFPEELNEQDVFLEGSACKVLVNEYERNPIARAKCIAHYGCNCIACGFSFEGTYGSIGRNYIHVHHIVTVSSNRGKVYQIDPVRDLRPLCPNCHAMIHQTVPPMSIADLTRRLTIRSTGPIAACG
jgi:5-methylcytosine-specific restriction protein A